MIININIDTADALDEHERVILLALAGEISLAEATEPRERPERTLAQAREDAKPTLDAIAEVAEGVQEAVIEAAKEEAEAQDTAKVTKRARVVNVSDESLEKYDFHRAEDGQIVCNHCDHVSETGRALHLHAGTHKDETPAKEKTLKAVPDAPEEAAQEPEAGVSAFTSTEPDKQDVADAEKAAAGDPDPESVAEVPEPVEAKVVDPKALRDEVAKVATEMVAANLQSDIRSVLDDLGVARVSMIAEEDLQKFLDSEKIAAYIAKKAG